MIMVNVDVGSVHLELKSVIIIDNHDLARLSLTVVRDRRLVLLLGVSLQQLNLIRFNTTMSTTRVDCAVCAASFTHRSVGTSSNNGRWSANVVRRVGERGRH